MKIEDVSQLKRFLAEVVIIVLIVIFARIIVENNDRLDWTMLVLPIAILLLSAALFLLERGHGGRVRIGQEPPADAEETKRRSIEESLL
jgi:uncharacterized membrane protein YqhA